MTKRKNYLITCLLCVVTICLMFCFNLSTVNADNDKFDASTVAVTGTATGTVTGEVDLPTFVLDDGASVRMKSPNGIRFETSISATDLAKLPVGAKFGTLIIPTSVLDGATLDLDAIETYGAVDVKAQVWRDKSTETKFVYSGVLIGSESQDFPAEFYDEEITARAYVTYTDSESTEYTIYSTKTERSLAYVAAAAVKGSQGLTEGEEGYIDPDDVTFLNGIVDNAVENIYFEKDTAVVTELTMQNGESVQLDLVGANDLPVIITTTGGVKLEGNILTATASGSATVTATVGTKTATVEIEVEKTVKEKIAEGLTGNQIANFNTADYAQLFSKATVDKYNVDTATTMEFASAHNCYRYADVQWNGTAFKIDFPVVKEYTEGYLVITISFNNENQAINGKFHVFNYDETNGNNAITFGSFVKEATRVYVPMSALVDNDNMLKGVQIAWSSWGGERFLINMFYSQYSYAIEENISSGEYTVGEEYDVSFGATQEGTLLDGANVTCTIADPTILTIENGKLTALKSGTTKVTLILWDGTSRNVAKYFNVTVAKSLFERLADELGENEIAKFNSADYMQTLSPLTINGYNGTPAEAEQLQFANSTDGIRYVPAWGGSGATITFVKQQVYTSGYSRWRWG